MEFCAAFGVEPFEHNKGEDRPLPTLVLDCSTLIAAFWLLNLSSSRLCLLWCG